MEELAEVRFFMSEDENLYDENLFNGPLNVVEEELNPPEEEEDFNDFLCLLDSPESDPNNEPFEVQEEVNTTEVQDFDDTNAPASKNDQQDGREAVRTKLQIHGRYHKNATVRIIDREVGSTTCSHCGQDGHNKTSCARKRKRD
jgi:hypothetical protein